MYCSGRTLIHQLTLTPFCLLFLLLFGRQAGLTIMSRIFFTSLVGVTLLVVVSLWMWGGFLVSSTNTGKLDGVNQVQFSLTVKNGTFLKETNTLTLELAPHSRELFINNITIPMTSIHVNTSQFIPEPPQCPTSPPCPTSAPCPTSPPPTPCPVPPPPPPPTCPAEKTIAPTSDMCATSPHSKVCIEHLS